MKKYLIWLGELFIWLIVIIIVSSIILFTQAFNVNQQYTYHAFFQDVDGLQKGSPVRLMGLQVGYVSNVKLINNTVFTTFIITEPDTVIPKGSYATTEFFGLGGSKSLEIYPPTTSNVKDKPLIEVKEPIRVNKFMKFSNDMATALVDLGDSVEKMVRDEDIKKYQNLIIKNSDLKNAKNYIDDINKKEDILIEKLENRKHKNE